MSLLHVVSVVNVVWIILNLVPCVQCLLLNPTIFLSFIDGINDSSDSPSAICFPLNFDCLSLEQPWFVYFSFNCNEFGGLALIIDVDLTILCLLHGCW